MNARAKKNRKCSLPVIILISMFLVSFVMPSILAADHTKISFDPTFAAVPPTISNVYPANKSTNIGLQITCRIQVNDINNDDLNVTWYSSSDGLSFNPQEIDSGVHSGDYVYWTYTQANQYVTKYYWKVAVDDGVFTTSAMYYFTTKDTSYPSPPPPPPPEPRINQEPIANITGPHYGYEGQSLVFYGGYSYDPDGTIVGYRWDFENDGLWDTDWQETAYVSHVYENAGNYTIKLQVQDNDSATAFASTDVTILALEPDQQLPIANISFPFANVTVPAQGYYEAFVNETIQFSSNGSYDPDGVIVSYMWDFGDYNTSQEANPSHVYTKPGNYSVILTVLDNQGLSNMDLALVIIKPIPVEEPPEEPEERALPLSLIAIIVGALLALIFAILVIFNTKRDGKHKPYTPVNKQKQSSVAYSHVDDVLVKDIETKVDTMIAEKTDKQVDEVLGHTTNES